MDKNLLIATWNIRAFGDVTKKWQSEDNDSPKRDFHSIGCIVEIIKRFDVIAVQEVTFRYGIRQINLPKNNADIDFKEYLYDI